MQVRIRDQAHVEQLHAFVVDVRPQGDLNTRRQPVFGVVKEGGTHLVTPTPRPPLELRRICLAPICHTSIVFTDLWRASPWSSIGLLVSRMLDTLVEVLDHV